MFDPQAKLPNDRTQTPTPRADTHVRWGHQTQEDTIRYNQRRVQFTYPNPDADAREADSVDSTFEQALDNATSEILMGQREGWWNLALAYDMVDRPGESFSALRQSARQGDIDGIMRYSNWLWEDGERAQAIRVRSRHHIVDPVDDPVDPQILRLKDVTLTYWTQVCHDDVSEETLAALADLDVSYVPDFAYWLEDHDRFEEAVTLLRTTIEAKHEAELLSLPLGTVLENHGDPGGATDSYAAGIAAGDFFCAFNLGTLKNDLGHPREARRLICLAASHGDRKAVRWLRSERRRSRRRRSRGGSLLRPSRCGVCVRSSGKVTRRSNTDDIAPTRSRAVALRTISGDLEGLHSERSQGISRGCTRNDFVIL
ncbi:Uncharacterised protein [Acidipropionibacterium jensenii]|uniref:Uncharacterized protein n=2 Tax=Acidipropionibacterium jensenii TaxID=1749 RepID=A0A3S4YX87_9ACTN|nr:hypothetical protein [Acidipropionibacterium jensenii]VEI03273.1 Uncharacterised protein [Acidipropionibacterium jensenii]